ncbi:DNA adenine methylase [Roseateles noduli]|uniref:DNA adenine methylase n=1 Tax=Roseateles noduli TaxID=2052484 RepID=UPI003D658BB2
MHAHPTSAALPPLAASKPLLKWPGGKQRLLSQLLPLLPPGSRLVEPFVGAGSVFLAASYDQYVISDANSDLVTMWVALKERPNEYATRASAFFVEEHRSQDAYLRVRAEFNGLVDRFERAVRLPYLNRFGFNGLFRVNRSGAFNTPYGKPAKVPTFPWEQVEAAAAKLERCLVLNGGFAAAMELAGDGDVVYCDPPYLDSETGASFTAYTVDAFGMEQHERLVECARQAVSRGAHVLISNHDTPEVHELYGGWDVCAVEVRRSVAAGSGSRGIAREVVARLAPPAVEIRCTADELVGSKPA